MLQRGDVDNRHRATTTSNHRFKMAVAAAQEQPNAHVQNARPNISEQFKEKVRPQRSGGQDAAHRAPRLVHTRT